MRNGNIILLNGPSSSGKTSILHALQNLMEEPYLEAGIDKFIYMLPGRYLERPLWDDVLGLAIQAGAEGHLLIAGMHRAIASLSRAGNHVIADHVLVEPLWLQDCANLFNDLPAYFIGIHCPLLILEQREQARRTRTLGQAKAQFGRVHAHCVYDLEVDTSINTPEECALQIQARMLNGHPPTAFRSLKLQTPA
jgi:chloramphenicol 3-O phosphotransferase